MSNIGSGKREKHLSEKFQGRLLMFCNSSTPEPLGYMNSMLTGCVMRQYVCPGSTEHCVMLVQWSKAGFACIHVQACMCKCVCKQTCHVGLSLWEVASAQSDYWAISAVTEVQGTMAGVKGRVYITHCLRPEPQTDTQTHRNTTSVDNGYPKQLSLSASTEKIRPWPRLVKVYIIG